MEAEVCCMIVGRAFHADNPCGTALLFTTHSQVTQGFQLENFLTVHIVEQSHRHYRDRLAFFTPVAVDLGGFYVELR